VTRLMAVQSADTLTPEQVAKYNSEARAAQLSSSHIRPYLDGAFAASLCCDASADRRTPVAL